jgi:hypothetical protein
VTKDELLQEIMNHPNTAKNYMLLAFKLNSPEETVTLIKQDLNDPDEEPVIMTQKELLLKTVELDDSQAIAYMALKNQIEDDETLTLNDGRTLTKREVILEAIDKAPNEPLPYSAMAFVTKGNTTSTLLDGRVMNKNQFYLEAVHLERFLGLMWYQKKYIVVPPDTVTLPDGRQLSQDQLVNAIITDPKDYLALAGLVATMKAATKKFIPDQLPGTTTQDPPPGEEKKREDLAIEAVKAAHEKAEPNQTALDAAIAAGDDTTAQEEALANYVYPFMILMLSMIPSDTVNTGITGIGETGHMGILKEMIRMAPQKAEYYLFGGLWLKPGETFTLPNNQQKNQKQMLEKTIELEPANAYAHVGLGYTISENETVTIDDTTMNRQQLFLKAAELDPDFPLVYLCLSLSITPGDKTPITVNGIPMTELELHEKYNSFSEE